MYTARVGIDVKMRKVQPIILNLKYFRQEDATIYFNAVMRWDEKDDQVKYVYVVFFLLIVTLTTLFAFQNSGAVNLSLLFTQITLPISVLIVMIYFLGMFTGGLLITLLRALVRNMAQKTDKSVHR